MPLEFRSISSARLGVLDREKTLFLFPVGPLEDHGPHLPMGLDLSESSEICRRLADRVEHDLAGWFVVIMPEAPLGVDSNTTGLALTVRPYVLRDWLIDSCASLARSGFRNFACVSGHLGPRQLTAIEEAGKMLPRRVGMKAWFSSLGMPGGRRKYTLVSASSTLVSGRDVRASPLWPDPPEHGGETDTSAALAISADQVEGIYRGLPEFPPGETFFGRAMMRWSRKRTNYWGAPAKASPELGTKRLNESVEKIYDGLKPVLLGAPPRSRFRSWYSVLPPNWSFFRAWLLAFSVFAVMLFYAILLLTTFTEI